MDAQEKVGRSKTEYEYEYDPIETETFYVDLDLSSANGGSKAPLTKRTLDLQPANVGEQVLECEQTPGMSGQAEDDAAVDSGTARGRPKAVTGTPGTTSQANEFQILELHGQNPVVSYQNQIYHCTWSDMIGTAMFFTNADAIPKEEASLTTGGFQLINTSRIKLIGQKAKLTERTGGKRRRPAGEDAQDTTSAGIVQDGDTAETNGKRLGEIRTGNAKANADIKRQAAFLERLMDVKRAKGESDNVRIVFGQGKCSSRMIRSRGAGAEAGRPARTQVFPSLAKEIEQLNRMVVRGDATALMRLQDIYSSMQNDAQNAAPRLTTPAAPSQPPQDEPPGVNMSEQP